MEFARVDLLSQVEITAIATPTLILTAGVKTEISSIFMAPDGSTELTLFHNGTAAVNRLFYRLPVTPTFQGPILAAQSIGNGIALKDGETLSATLESGTGITLSVYGVTARLPQL